MAKHRWDRQNGESAEHYAWFLFYRNLGPSRTIMKAFRKMLVDSGTVTPDEAVEKYKKVPTTWPKKCTEWSWVDRAGAWDIHNLVTVGTQVAALHSSTMLEIAKKNLATAKKEKPGSTPWRAMIDSTKVVGEFLSPEVIDAVSEASQREPAGETDAAGARPANRDE